MPSRSGSPRTTTSSRWPGRTTQLETLAQEIERAGGSCRPRVVDLTNPDAVASALSGIDAQVLVNNAGVGALKPFMELTPR